MNAHHRVDGEEIEVANSWATSVTSELERSRRIAWIVAIIASIIALLLAAAILIMLPLKSVEPYTLLVDRQTGNVETLAPLDQATVQADTALTRSLLAQYVVSRESFDRADLQRDYRKTMLFSGGEERQRYAGELNTANPASPLAYMPPGSSLSTEIKSISSLTSDSALVRFVTTRRDRGARAQEPQHWAAVINFQFSGAQMSEDDRLINPLGFQVTRYRRDQESVLGTSAIDVPASANTAPANLGAAQ